MKAIIALLGWLSLGSTAASAQTGQWRIEDKTDALYGTPAYTAALIPLLSEIKSEIGFGSVTTLSPTSLLFKNYTPTELRR